MSRAIRILVAVCVLAAPAADPASAHQIGGCQHSHPLNLKSICTSPGEPCTTSSGAAGECVMDYFGRWRVWSCGCVATGAMPLLESTTGFAVADALAGPIAPGQEITFAFRDTSTTDEMHFRLDATESPADSTVGGISGEIVISFDPVRGGVLPGRVTALQITIPSHLVRGIPSGATSWALAPGSPTAVTFDPAQALVEPDEPLRIEVSNDLVGEAAPGTFEFALYEAFPAPGEAGIYLRAVQAVPAGPTRVERRSWGRLRSRIGSGELD